ncbi:MAG: NAD(P)/FAD-dependent oxidoreductase [Methanomicrobiaceae archaeon]|nr:NAD(P)/FAD-dependent oxidoreductase [Methanomicrobiaceae archaeon]
MTTGCFVVSKTAEKFDVIVAGGGPAGLFCAAWVSGAGKKVLLIEKKDSCGKKLLITGLSQCNLTQDGDIKSFFSHYGDNGKFLRPSLLSFKNTDLISFFNERGLETVAEKGNKIFPATKKAQDILRILLSECERNGVLINCCEGIIDAFKKDDLFVVNTAKSSYSCENLVIATGGITYPATGSTGDGYKIAKGFGHTISETGPALCAVSVFGYNFQSLSGISFRDVKISLYHENKKAKENSGDILFTHTGLSGPGILHMSRFIKPGDTLRISFIPGMTADAFRQDFSKKTAESGIKTVKSVLLEYGFPERFAKKIMDLSETANTLTCAHLSKDKRNIIVGQICEHNFIVNSLSGLNEAMVTRGGVSLSEINPKTMESKICPHLYFAGEVLDIDGDTGGYNLQAAFSTGYMAAKNIIQ